MIQKYEMQIERRSLLRSSDRGTIFIYSVALIEIESNLNAYWCALSAGEKARAEKYKCEEARREYILSRGFLKARLAQFLGESVLNIEIAEDKNGKPFLKSPAHKIQFNSSHSQGRLAIVFAQRGIVGIDIEKINWNQDLGVAQQVFSQAEIQELNRYSPVDRVRAFFKGWTQKEAVIKALGIGMFYPLKSFSVLLNPQEDGKLLHAERSDLDSDWGWQMQCLEIHPDYFCSIFYQGNDLKIKFCGVGENGIK